MISFDKSTFHSNGRNVKKITGNSRKHQKNVPDLISHPTFTCSKLTIEILDTRER